jgi:seryl-tRNA synthetase
MHESVPIGNNESENVVTKIVGEKPQFDFEKRDHITLMQMHDMVDIER